ncbi:MAG: sporulation protein YqfD [Anaerostipes sp.]|nr:sporulation protein YqfD [Anaerostipes sp.]
MTSGILFIIGTYEIEMSGVSMERCLNLCSKQGIVMWKLKPVENGYRFLIKRSCYKDLIAVSKKTNTKIQTIGGHGLPFFFVKHKKRKSFFLGMSLCVLLVFLLSQFVWNITVTGVETYSKETILKFAEKEHYKIGTYKHSIDCNILEERIREQFKKIAWVSCSMTGTRLKIDIKETLDQNTTQNVKKPCDIVSNKTGVVTFLSIKNGTPLVRPGTKVKEGDTLISGLIYYYSDDFQKTQTDKIKADGTVYLKTKELYYESIPVVQYKKQYINTRNQISNIKIGNLNISLPIKKKIFHTDILQKEKRLKLWGEFYLPASVVFQKQKEYEVKKETLKETQGKNILKKRVVKYKKQLKEKGIRILGEKITYEYKKNNAEAKGYFVVEESVGKIRNIHPLTKKQEKYITPTTAQPK